MSSIKDNDIYKKTSFLAGVNSRQIDELYTQYLENPSSLTPDWRNFFQGLGDEEKNIIDNSNGPSWSRKNTIKIKIDKSIKINLEKENSSSDLKDISVTQAAKDSVRAIMLIRAYRIRGHLIANLDPLDIQQRDEHPELKPETYGFTQKDHKRDIFLDGVLGLQKANLNTILKILKKTYSSNIGYEFMHMGDPQEKAWIRDRIEGPEKEITFTEKWKKSNIK